MQAEIITIGDEILIGQVVDTNSAWLATQLNSIGIEVLRITSIHDKHEDIVNALSNAFTRADLIVCTGGLGPTSDDVTKLALAKYFNTELVSYPDVIERITALLTSRDVQLNERNIKQAELPRNCEILRNSCGTAQGMWFKKDGKDCISLPGVPYEMKAIFSEEIEHRLKQRFILPAIHHITLLTQGVPESVMADTIGEWERMLPPNLRLAYLPSPGILRLRLSGKTNGDIGELKTSMENEIAKISAIIGKPVFGRDDDKLEVIIGNMLNDKKKTLAVAESCTGGWLSAMITSVPGSSAYFKGGVVSYSNDIKISELNVSPQTLMINGAVSQPVVEQMADGVRQRYATDFAIAISGIAGPGGGSDEKPVGTTWIAVATKKRIIANVYNLGEDRGRNIQKAAITALFMLRDVMTNS